MCGICGRISFRADESEDPAFFTDQMMHLLQHRGPDDSGLWSDSHAALGHRRLSIIDLSPEGHQPMMSQDGARVLVFNGEIYNYRELRKQFDADEIPVQQRYGDPETL
jgi:asparagine synthase (glutamine-hydrolysing)